MVIKLTVTTSAMHLTFLMYTFSASQIWVFRQTIVHNLVKLEINLKET